MDAEVSFGLWLQKRRKALDLTREELAQKIGCSASALRKIETGKRHPSKQLAELLARALEIPADEHSSFIRIARGELSIGRLKASSPLPDINLLESSPTLSNSIPIPPTPLIGREPELVALRQMLADPQCRLISLVGPGGIGKTRLAMEVAREQSGEFVDGAAFVSLSSVNSADLLIPTVASTLNIRFYDPSEPKKQLLNYLREKKTFLVLDNLEHLLDGVGIVGEIIQYAPKVKVLCTSREQLNLHDEWVFDVRGLPVPQNMEDMDFNHGSAVTLFLQRTRQVMASLNLRDEDDQAILRICKLVEGMPLAIELSAVWARTLSFQEIALEIEKSLDFLSTNVHGIPERHRSLRAVFDHSWRLLTAEERQVLMKLAVFRGGFTRDLAKQVANASLNVLSALILKSLLYRNSAEGRYDVHEAVRQYAWIQLQEANMVEQTCDAHLQAFVQLAEKIEPELTGNEQDRWIAYLETEHDNFRAALRWAFDSKNVEASLRLATALWHFWHLHSHFVEGSRWLEWALQAAGPAAPAGMRAKALKGAGSLAYYQNHFDQAIRWLEECLALQAQLSEGEIAHAQVTLALLIQEKSEFARAWSLCEEAIQHFRNLNDEYGILRTLNNQGTLAYDMGDLNTASRLFGEALILARKRNDKDYVATCLTNLGWAAAIRGDAKAIELCREAITMFRELGSKIGIAFCLEGIGAGIALAGRPNLATQLFGAANALRESISAPPSDTNLRYLETMRQPARDALSDTVFASAWAEGEAMTVEQAIECALTAFRRSA